MIINCLPNNTLLHGGTYKIIRFINCGGFGYTYEAEHILLEKRVAIKEFFIKDFCNRDEETANVTVGTMSKMGLVKKLRGKFVDEAKALAKLHHPGIVRVSDVFEENGTAYYVMDYIEGKSLSQIVKECGPLSEAIALRYIHEVCEALAYVHNKNRLHLDIKPGNIMVEKDESGKEHAVLIDFGASKQYDEEDGENTSTLMGKTPGYASIEQMGNCVGKFLPATDIYSLGATLYKLLSGITPLEATALSSGETLAPLPSSVSASTISAVSAAMQLNKRLRPQSVKDFLMMLDFEDLLKEEETVIDVKSKERSSSNRIINERTSQPTPLKSSTRTKRKFILPIWAKVCVAVVFGILCFIFLKPIPEKDLESSVTGAKNGYKYVDMGLSVLWATCNVGANSPEDYGKFFAWGEIDSKHVYTSQNSKTYMKIMSDLNGNHYIDAAKHNWGGDWRLPTISEIDELIENSTTRWTSYKGMMGRLVISKKNGNTIFFPAAGERCKELSYYAGKGGFYWSSTPVENNNTRANILFFTSEIFESTWNTRDMGFSVRPVRNR